MERDPRYKTAKILITSGHIKAFREIFDLEVIPKSVVARDLGLNNVRFTQLMFNVEKFTYKDTFLIAALIGIDEQTITSLIIEQYLLDKRSKKKKPK
ncbi:MAG TPA: hypothetical protein VHD83_25860 [Puia sp.]|nr:hypothetical protein [Puia sp.]